MKRVCSYLLHSGALILCGLLLHPNLAHAQFDVPGQPIGKISTDGELMVMELEDGALGKANLFDLAGHDAALQSGRFALSRGEWRLAVGLGLRPSNSPGLKSPCITLHSLFPARTGIHSWWAQLDRSVSTRWKATTALTLAAVSAESRSVDLTR